MLHEDVATTGPAPPAPPDTPLIIDQLKEILADDLDIRLKREEIDETVPLLEGGLALDSVVIIELVGRIEDRFGLRFGDESLRTDLFKNLTTLAEFIAAQTVPAGQKA